MTVKHLNLFCILIDFVFHLTSQNSIAVCIIGKCFIQLTFQLLKYDLENVHFLQKYEGSICSFTQDCKQ